MDITIEPAWGPESNSTALIGRCEIEGHLCTVTLTRMPSRMGRSPKELITVADPDSGVLDVERLVIDGVMFPVRRVHGGVQGRIWAPDADPVFAAAGEPPRSLLSRWDRDPSGFTADEDWQRYYGHGEEERRASVRAADLAALESAHAQPPPEPPPEPPAEPPKAEAAPTPPEPPPEPPAAPVDRNTAILVALRTYEGRRTKAGRPYLEDFRGYTGIDDLTAYEVESAMERLK